LPFFVFFKEIKISSHSLPSRKTNKYCSAFGDSKGKLKKKKKEKARKGLWEGSQHLPDIQFLHLHVYFSLFACLVIDINFCPSYIYAYSSPPSS